VTDLIDRPSATTGPGADTPARRPWRDWLPLVLLVVGIASLGVFFGLPVLFVVLAIIVSVFLHEMGHYLVARWAGMKVTEFFIGFGPRLWSFRRGETEYGVKLIPAGAYVRIVGMHNLEEVPAHDERRTYRAQPYRKRLPVILAGPFANFAIALVLLFVLYVGIGAPQAESWHVDRVLPGSAADRAGVESGDRIVSVNGRPVGEFDELIDAVQPAAGQPAELVVIRDGRPVTLATTIGWRLDESAADALAPLADGDQLLSVDGEPVTTYEALQADLAARAPGTVTVTFERGPYRYEADVRVPVTLPDDGYVGFLGVGQRTPPVRLGPLDAARETASTFGTVVVESLKGLGRFFSPAGLGRYWEQVTSTPPTGEESPPVDTSIRPLDRDAPPPRSADPADQDRVISILGVIQLGSQAAESGVATLVFLLIMVNVFLGLVNLVPLLPFDGGHAAVATYEAVRGRISGRPYRVNMAKLMPVTYAVVLLMVFIGLTSMYLDIVDPVRIQP
jgi:RIP metalloprotease RseP